MILLRFKFETDPGYKERETPALVFAGTDGEQVTQKGGRKAKGTGRKKGIVAIHCLPIPFSSFPCLL